MAESLLFRKGSLAGLETAAKVAGAVSFTTDEPAIYLDVQEGNEVVRKRIGDLIVYDTADELIAAGNTAVKGTVGSWSKTALYYVVSTNSLLKWNGSTWTQINSVSDVEASFNELNKTVNGDGTSTNPGLVSKVSTLENEMGQSQGDIADLKDVIGEVPDGSNLYALLQAEIIRSTNKDTSHDTDIATLKGTVGDANSGLVKQVEANKQAIAVNAGNITNNANAIDAIKNHATVDSFADVMTEMAKYQVAGDYATKAQAQSYANTAKTDAVNEAKGYTDGQIDLVEAEILELQNAGAALDTAVKDAQETADNITTLVGKSTDNGTTTLYGVVNKEISRSSDIDEDHEERIDALEATINTATTGLSAVVAKHTQDISDLKNEDAEIKQSVSNNATAIGTEKSRAEREEARIEGLITAEVARATAEEGRLAGLISGMDADYKAKDTELSESIRELTNTVAENKRFQDAENLDIRADFAAADTALETKLTNYINTNMATADAMKYKGVITNGALPTTTSGAIEGGWTYKVSGNFTPPATVDTAETKILTGDLLIASKDLAEGETVPADFWHHISSGYEDDKDPILTGIATHDAEGKKIEGVDATEIVMKSHTGDDRGSIKFIGATGQNVVISSVATADDAQTGDMSTTVTVGLNWIDF